MLRGQFERGDGLILPNNITQFGIQTLLELALRDEDADFWVGLCSAVYTPDLTVADISEPSIGTNGYARIAVPRSALGWPNSGTINSEFYLQTDFLIWTASGGDFDIPISRMFICLHETSLVADVFALSAALPDEITITPLTVESERKFRYSIFGH